MCLQCNVIQGSEYVEVDMADIKEIRKVKDAQYGDPSISLTNIGLSWTATLQQYYGITLDKPIPAPIVAQMYANAKLIRLATPNLPKAGFDDNLVDTKVYVDIIEETEAKTRQVYVDYEKESEHDEKIPI